MTKAPEKMSNPFEGAVAVSLSVGRLGIRRHVSEARVETKGGEVDQTMVSVSKATLDCPEYKRIAQLDAQVRGTILSCTVPSVLRRGCYLVKLEALPVVDATLEEYQVARERMVQAFVGVYAQARNDAKTRLGPLFNPRDYPTEESVGRAFYVESRYISFDVPQMLEKQNREIFQREKEKLEADFQAAGEEIRNALRCGFKDLVNRLVERLTPETDGSKKKFKDSTVKNLQEFLKTFDLRDMTGDEGLKSLVEKARSIVGGMDPDSLRVEENLADSTRKAFEEMSQKLETMVKPTRRISFDEEAA